MQITIAVLVGAVTITILLLVSYYMFHLRKRSISKSQIRISSALVDDQEIIAAFSVKPKVISNNEMYFGDTLIWLEDSQGPYTSFKYKDLAYVKLSYYGVKFAFNNKKELVVGTIAQKVQGAIKEFTHDYYAVVSETKELDALEQILRSKDVVVTRGFVASQRFKVNAACAIIGIIFICYYFAVLII
jgi:hypothetical protein